MKLVVKKTTGTTLVRLLPGKAVTVIMERAVYYDPTKAKAAARGRLPNAGYYLHGETVNGEKIVVQANGELVSALKSEFPDGLSGGIVRITKNPNIDGISPYKIEVMEYEEGEGEGEDYDMPEESEPEMEDPEMVEDPLEDPEMAEEPTPEMAEEPTPEKPRRGSRR